MSNRDSNIQISLAKSTHGDAGLKSHTALTEANKHADLLYTSLAGVAAIVVVLLTGLALPVFDRPPIASALMFMIMALTALIGVVWLCYINVSAHSNVTMQALLTEELLNSLGQGFLSFDQYGKCSSVFSQACLDLLEDAPAGKLIVDVLKLTEEQKSDFNDWLEMLFTPNHALGFDDASKFLPQTYAHSGGGRHIALSYRPVRDADEKLLSVILVAIDQTEEAEAQLRARVQQNYVNMICRVFKERNQFMVTITHLRKFVAESRTSVRISESSTILRLLHTLKAAAKHFYLESLSDVIRRLEVDLRHTSITTDAQFQGRLRHGGEEVDACITAILTQIGDLIGQDFEGQGNVHEVNEDAIYSFAKTMQENNISRDVVEQYLSVIAAEPINDLFHQFERELKDLAVIMGKKVKPIHYTGTNPRVLARPLEEFFLSLMHICRNIVDHAIEPAVTRIARGKEPAGTVTIHSELLPGQNGRRMVLLSISDDGNGIDPALVRDKLSKIDPDGSWTSEDDVSVIQRILLWEVSTKSTVSEISGRGVGMEAVAREITQLGGSIKVTSELYKSTRFDILIPYNLDGILDRRA